MARAKRKSSVLDTARQRLAGLKKITDSDFGTGMNPIDYGGEVDALTEARFGSDSNEYEMVGGTRRSERKKPSKKKPGDGSPPTK
jgi:hypothetical protein